MLQTYQVLDLPSDVLPYLKYDSSVQYTTSVPLPLIRTGIISSGSSAQTAWPVEDALRRIQADTWISAYLSRWALMEIEQEAQQREIHQRLVAKGLVTPGRQSFRLISPPLTLEGKPLSQCLAEVRG
jgi:hypothetical protein